MQPNAVMMQTEHGSAEPAHEAVPFRPLQRVDGQLPIEDHGLIGDGTTAALVGRDGTVWWMCLPRFDSAPVFAGLLDVDKGGTFALMMEDAVESRQWYERDTAVLVTELRGPSGVVRITDALVVFDCDLAERARADRGELLREVRAIEGYPGIRLKVRARGQTGVVKRGDALEIAHGRSDVELSMASTKPLNGPDGLFWLHPGERAYVSLRWRAQHDTQMHAAPRRLDDTRRAWRAWAAHIDYDGPARALVRRSVLTLKQLHYLENGAIIAAPTTSLPEVLGGRDNWDYRFSWIRDAAFTVEALREVGLPDESGDFVRWVLDATAHDGRPKTLYDVEGHAIGDEKIDETLRGYRGSGPVRINNAAAKQDQRDVLGHVLECAWEYVQHHGDIDAEQWARLKDIVEQARTTWRTPDHGIWEERGIARRFTYSAAQCHVALKRGIAIAEELGFPADVEAWRTEAHAIERAIIEESWDERLGGFCNTIDGIDGRSLDPSLLSLALRDVVPADHPRMIATRAAIRRELDVGDGLLVRSLEERGAFLFCTGLLVENLAASGEKDEARAVFERLCACASRLGLLSEEFDPSTNGFLGNFPQGISHVALVRAALAVRG